MERDSELSEQQTLLLYCNPHGLPPTVFFSYHPALAVTRPGQLTTSTAASSTSSEVVRPLTGASTTLPVVRVVLPPRSVKFWSYWERNTVKNAMSGANIVAADKRAKVGTRGRYEAAASRYPQRASLATHSRLSLSLSLSLSSLRPPTLLRHHLCDCVSLCPPS